MAKDLLAFSADGPWQSWQMAEDLLAFSADGLGSLGIWSRVSWQMVQGFMAYGPGFLGKWSRISRQMAKNLSIATSFPLTC